MEEKFNKCKKCSIEIENENKIFCDNCLYDFIHDYKTYHTHGFIQEEIEEIIKMFPKFNRDKFDDAMMGNTCMMTSYKGENRLVNYHCDILSGLRCGIENRDLYIDEWD